MTCPETQIFIDAFIDGELDLARSIELERHLESCPKCWALCQVQKGAHTSSSDPALRYSAPASLRKRVQAALAAEDRHTRERPALNLKWLYWRRTAGVLGLLAAVVAFVFVVRLPTEDPLERELVDSHIRSLMPNHLMDVVSTDQHTVKPWFAGKVDFSPPVKDFAAEGFPLEGGRVDYVGGHSAAVLVYQRNKHVINVFVWAAPGAASSPRAHAEQGYNMIELGRSDMEFWLVSDLNGAELRQLANMLGN